MKSKRQKLDPNKAYVRTRGGPWKEIKPEATRKLSNPKDTVGVRKAYLSTVPLPVLMEMGLGMLEGACKYGRHNYRTVGVRASVYFDGAVRHLFDWWEGEDIDPDSGLHHLVKLLTDIAVLRDAMLQGKLTDDRPPEATKGWLARLNRSAGLILDKYPNPKPAHIRKSRVVKGKRSRKTGKRK